MLVEPTTVVLRARGSAYATDVECLRHLATQMTNNLESVPHANASFKAGMDWIKSVFKGSFKQARAMVMVLDQFEYFCSRARQTLLYNLFDIAQEAGVHLSVIGTSDHYAVMDSLEKRIKSRFSMRHIHTFLPSSMPDLVQVLMARLRLSSNCGLKAAFLRDFHKQLETALISKNAEWQSDLDLGRPPSWFFAKCLPVTAMLRSAEADKDCAPSTPPSKRTRPAPASPGCLPSVTSHETRSLLLEQLSRQEHCILIALCRLHERRVAQTLAAVLHEIRLLHEGTQYLTAGFKEDSYCFFF